MTRTDLRRKHLEARLESWRGRESRALPGGWLKAIRGALGMSATSLGRRMGVSRQAVMDLEQREQEGTATIDALRKAAEQLDAELVYAIVPRKRLSAQVEDQARKKAAGQVKRVAHSMALENQGTSEAEVERLIQERTRELLNKGGLQLWQDD